MSERADGSGNQTERLPWCENCEAFSVPLDDGSCGECGGDVVFREGPE